MFIINATDIKKAISLSLAADLIAFISLFMLTPYSLMPSTESVYFCSLVLFSHWVQCLK